MTDDTKKVFLSYRRALSIHLAGRVHEHLTAHGYDVFFDVSSISSGQFGRIILHQIEARPVFVPVLVPGCFDRATDPDDWFRREIEHALATKRHIVPLAATGFSFETAAGGKGKALPGRLGELARYHYIEVPDAYFAEAMNKLKAGLAIPRGVNVFPTPEPERPAVLMMLNAAKTAKPDAAGLKWIRIRPDLTVPLQAPTLKANGPALLVRRLSWSAEPCATGYILESGCDRLFLTGHTIYDGNDTNFLDTEPVPIVSAAGTARHYRVKAKGDGSLFSDSPWSNVVVFDKPWSLRPLLSAPKLELHPLSLLSLGRRFTWSAVEGATGYVLEKGKDEAFVKPVTIYAGKDCEFTEVTIGGIRTSILPQETFYYRVKATLGSLADSEWSNIVESGPSLPLT